MALIPIVFGIVFIGGYSVGAFDEIPQADNNQISYVETSNHIDYVFSEESDLD